MARYSWTGPRGNRATARERTARTEIRAWTARYPRVRQNHRRRRRGSTGDDRHLRFRRRPVANALWAYDSIGTAEPSLDGAMAPARPGRGNFRLQFPRRRL